MNLIELNLFVNAAKTAVATKGMMEYRVSNEVTGAYPYTDELTSECKPTIATVFTMKEPTGTKGHNVVLAYAGFDDYAIWCGDNFIEDGKTKIPPEDRIARAALLMPGLGTARATQLLGELRGVAPASTGCHFWSNFKTKKSLCKHCNQLLTQKAKELPDILRALQERYELDIEGKVVAPAATVTPDHLARTVLKAPVMLQGEKGWGKTREARMTADTLGATLIEVHGNESVEAADLTGYTVRHGHDMVWKDGRLAQAFRLAAKGQKVLLMLDELLRVPQRQLSVLLSALSPHRGNYCLATGRIVDVVDGIGSEETLVCPVSNLYIIATTNVGVQYAVDVMDPALKERFVLIRKAVDVGILKSAVLEAALDKGFSPTVADKCVEFFKAMLALRPNSLVADIPNPRTMVRAVELSDAESDMKASVVVQLLTWVDLDVAGEPVPEQVDAVNKAINKVWP
jgi:hypothetical protein